MKTVNSISGGKSSAYVAINYPADYNVFALVRVEDEDCRFPDETLRKRVEDRIQKPFIGTVEMNEIVYTIFDLEQYMGREIKWVSGETFEKVIQNKGGYIPNKVARFCTTELKIRPIFHYLHDEGALPCITQLGFRAGEENRLLKKINNLNDRGFEEFKATFTKNKNGTNKWEIVDFSRPSAPLIDDRKYRSDVNNFFIGKSIRFADMNNCVGCHWRPEPLLNLMSQKRPPKYNWFIKQEKSGKGTFKTGITYEEIKNANFTLPLEFDDFSPCDSGYCGI